MLNVPLCKISWCLLKVFFLSLPWSNLVPSIRTSESFANGNLNGFYEFVNTIELTGFF